MISAEAIQTLLNQGASGAPVRTLPDGGLGIVVPPNYGVKAFPPVNLPLPDHIKQVVTMHDRGSFVDYVNEFKTLRSRIFAEPGFLAQSNKARFVAIIDYHRSGGDEGEPDRCAHLALYEPRYSEQWERWQAVCGSGFLKQAQFAELIEECRRDIVQPDAANLLDIVRTFKASKRTEFDSYEMDASGNVKLHYSDTVEKHGATAAMPERMTLGIPVYYGETPYSVGLFVRFRIVQGAVLFDLKLDRPDIIEDDAFKGMMEVVRSECELPVHMGTLRV